MGPFKRVRPRLLLLCVTFALGLAWSAAADMIGHGGIVRSVAVSPDGKTVLTGSFDYTAKLWDFVEQNELAEFDAHFGPVNAVAFLPGGRGVLTASDDNSVILWDLAVSSRPGRGRRQSAPMPPAERWRNWLTGAFHRRFYVERQGFPVQ